ncbi:dihydropteroate synthase [Sulfitobacter aestuariivivens]|uniref:dihydropteroate synthase n=1 Tax=Sulfitobacter aestuariivivens TaxID=2766981 RepID=UPI0031B61213
MSDTRYFRPIVQVDTARPSDAFSLAGGWGWFTHVELLSRSDVARIVSADHVPEAVLARLCDRRPDICGLDFAAPQMMGILNATPDSFSDGGKHAAVADACAAGLAMQAAGANILDIGGESTRPGAETIPNAEEISRVTPVIDALNAAGVSLPISIDTRKSAVAASAISAGAALVNDVSGFTHDPALMAMCAARQVPVCVTHGPQDPSVMQEDPRYDNVLLDVFDFLEKRIDELETAGIPRGRIIADPGIGFGKTIDHNLALLARLSLFHGLGVPLLLGASRKRFIGAVGGAPDPQDRAPGSIGVALAALNHGVQVFRVHDVAQTHQAIALWQAAIRGEQS